MTNRGTARIGILVPFTNTNLEQDMMMLAPAGASLHFTRIGGYDEDEIPDEDQMEGLGAANIEEPLHLLQGARPDVILYGCTSATLAHGPSFDRELATKIKSHSGVQTVTAAGGLVAALRSLQVSRIGFASPYVAALNDRAIGFLADEGFETVSRAAIGEALGNDEQGALAPDAVFELGRRANSPDAQAIVLSCTDMRSVEVIDQLEQSLGKPVVTSNQAMMFQTLRMLGISDVPSGFGQLFDKVAP
ncbi:Asp/Glu racemase [uncultured Roseovarius sp.]|uniref:maleate cis-trans isomerase family protein n=1 Tax=uncultured Roseovarius sp. TaxID=293344 RepID=UPI002631A117|nr:Asp/Glu racemase [uncultured Roseovarius sp.]